MTNPFNLTCAVLGATLLVVTGCTIHPPGEPEERQAAKVAGEPYLGQFESRELPPLAADAPPDELVRYALLANAELEQRYWEWCAAIEQVPQDGTQPTTLVLFAGVPISRGSTAFNRTTVTVANDPMANIQWPSKPATAARRALENARAAGLRFQKTRYDLRRRVLNAYYDYALTAELVRLEQANADLLGISAVAAEAGNRAGRVGQSDVLKAHNEIDLSRNQVAELQARLPALRATLNALLGRGPSDDLAVPRALPPLRPLGQSDEQLIHVAAERNPELVALDHDVRARKDGLRLAKLQYIPDFSLSASTDLAGIAQNLMGMVTVPLLRYEAINAAIAQAQANIRATEAMRRQTVNDLRAQLLADVVSIRDAERQLVLLEHTILPRASRAVSTTRSAYEVGRTDLSGLLDGQRSLIALQRLAATLRIMQIRQVTDLETIAAIDLQSR